MFSVSRGRRASAVIALAAAVAVGASACSSGGSSAASGAGEDSGELIPVKVAATMSVGQGALFLGIEQGFFEDEGLDIETVPVANPPASLAAVQSGQVDFGYAPSIPLMNALSQNIPVRVVASADGFEEGAIDAEDHAELDDTGLYASPKSGITDLADLKGKTIGVPARKAQHEVTIANALKDAGVEPDEVEWVALDYTSAIAALESGSIDAAGLVSPFTFEAQDAGAVLLASPGVSFFEEGAIGLWTTGAATLEQKPEVIEAFQRAMEKTNAYANEHPQEAIDLALKNSGSELAVEDVKTPYWPLEVKDEDLNRVNDRLTALGFLDEPVDISGIIVPMHEG